MEVENLREILKKNSSPSGILEQSIKPVLNKVHVPKKVIPTVPKKKLFIVGPYLEMISSNLNFKNSLPQCNIKIILKSTNRLFPPFRFKDVIAKELQSRIVNIFSCGNYSVTCYGKTEHHLNVRSTEHIRISRLTGKKVECKPSAVSDHLLMLNQDSNFNNFPILCRDNNGFRLLLKESILMS